jgi:hypothetical protein
MTKLEGLLVRYCETLTELDRALSEIYQGGPDVDCPEPMATAWRALKEILLTEAAA